MRYSINKQNYKTLSVFREGTLPMRAYFVPYASRSRLEETAITDERYRSEVVTVLSGEWDCKYYPKVSDLPDSLDTASIGFDSVTVPGCWTRYGYEKPVYLNVRYPFLPTPPHFPTDCAVAVYRKLFRANADAKRTIITFLGVAGAYDLYLNGVHLGYAEGSHNTHEFDLTEYLTDGDNELVMVLFKWSNGTYLECQDMFRDNGIFRDVLLTSYGEAYIFDMFADCSLCGTDGKLEFSAELCGECTAEVELYDGENEVARATAQNGKAALAVKEAKLWSAEEPNLYTLYVTLKGLDGAELQCVRLYVGFKKVEIKGNVFYFNGKKIKILGVNHHDTNPKTGYVLSASEYLADLQLMKSLNMNAVRTSHYPPDPVMLTLCDKLGLYVIDEADIETHGANYVPGQCPSGRPEWKLHYLDRVQSMYYRDRNHVSITLWSLGNEAAGIINQDSCYEWLKTVTDIPVHYEGACREKRGKYDVVSMMYTAVDRVLNIADGKCEKRFRDAPFLLCEYVHAMGVGPGGMEEYVDAFYSKDGLMGGCIWEWADHSVYYGNGKNEYTYGGDHDEKKHDGNFCCDGVVFPDRSLMPSGYLVKNIYRPIRCCGNDGKRFVFESKEYFKTRECELIWELRANGVTVQSGTVALKIAPQEKRELTIDYTACEGELYMVFVYKEDGREIAREDTAICPVAADRQPSAPATGSYQLKDFVPLPNIYRVPFDNDKIVGKLWRKFGYNNPQTKVTERAEGNAIAREYKLRHGIRTLFRAQINTELQKDGSLYVVAVLKGGRLLPPIGRFGTSLELPAELKHVRYYGLGEHESLCDYRRQCVLGIYETEVAKMHVPYVKPQESGMRSEVRWFELYGDDGEGIRIECLYDYLICNANYYRPSTLDKAKHREDVIDEGLTYLQIDGFQRGVGTQSCGPTPWEKYRLKNGYFKFAYRIVPIKVQK